VKGANVLLPSIFMSSTFSQKFLLMVAAGFVAACLLWAFRHIVQQALWETSDAGWKQSLYQKPAP
jgi:hypothetical protein